MNGGSIVGYGPNLIRKLLEYVWLTCCPNKKRGHFIRSVGDLQGPLRPSVPTLPRGGADDR